MTVDYLFSRFTDMNYIADYIGFTDHPEEPPDYTGLPNHKRAPYYTGSSYYVLRTYYLKAGTQE